jgi:hypothetical protein
LSKISGQEYPGLCLLTIFALGGVMGPNNHQLEGDFTLLLWLSISLHDCLSRQYFTVPCVTILAKRITRFMTVIKTLIGEQREYESSTGLRMAKFHGLKHFPDQIKKFGAAINSFGGTLESFLKWKLKRPAIRTNRHRNRLRYDILKRSNESRLLHLAKRIIFPVDYTSLLLELEEEEKTAEPDDCALPCDHYNEPYKLPIRPNFTASWSYTDDPIKVKRWCVKGRVPNQAAIDSSLPHPDGTRSDYYNDLFHPDFPNREGCEFVHAFVRGAILRGLNPATREAESRTYPSFIDFYYHCRIPSSDVSANKTGPSTTSPSILLRCNPVWHGQSATKLGKQWFDWVEVNWTNDDGAVFTVPARLALWGKVHYADDTNELLAVVRSLKNDGIMPPHDRMFFARGGYLDTSYEGLCLVEFESILSTAFVIPALPPATESKIPKRSELLDALVSSNYYVALPARAEWSVLGWDELLSSENSK